MEYFDPEAGLGVPVIRPGMRLETASRWIFRKAGYEKGRRTELAQRLAIRRDRTELIQHLKSAPCSKMIRYDAGGGCRLSSLIILTKQKHDTVSSCSRLYPSA